MTTKNRREFLKSGAAGLAAIALFRNANGEIVSLAEGDPFPELIEVTISQLQAQMKSGKLNARKLTAMYLERVRQYHTKTRSVPG